MGPLLRKYLDDLNSDVCAAAKEALGFIGPVQQHRAAGQDSRNKPHLHSRPHCRQTPGGVPRGKPLQSVRRFVRGIDAGSGGAGRSITRRHYKVTHSLVPITERVTKMLNGAPEQIFQFLFARRNFLPCLVNRYLRQVWMRQRMRADFVTRRQPLANLRGIHERFGNLTLTLFPFVRPPYQISDEKLNGLELIFREQWKAMAKNIAKPVVKRENNWTR